MKKFIILFSLLALAIAPVSFANILPDNMEHSNTISSSVATISTVANVKTCASGTTNQLALVTDANSATDCTTGSGSTVNWCYCNGSVYTDVS